MPDSVVSDSFWDKRAAVFGENPSPTLAVSAHDEVHKRYKDFLQKKAVFRILRLDRGMVVLDLGCGVGRWSFALAPKVKKVFGVDVSKKMVSIARKILCGSRIRNVEFRRASAENLPFKDGSFDLVLSVTVLQHVKPRLLPAAVRELHRVCKQKGAVCILESTSGRARASYLHPLPVDGWEDVFEKNGFALKKLESVSMMPLDRLFNATSLAGSKAGLKGKSHKVRLFSRVFKTAILAASLPIDLYLSRYLKNLGDQKVMVFERV